MKRSEPVVFVHTGGTPALFADPSRYWQAVWSQSGSSHLATSVLSCRAIDPCCPPRAAAMLNQLVEYMPQTRLDTIYQALSHPVRRDLVDRLSRVGPRGIRVTELAAPYTISLAAVSKHIRVLEVSGLVRRTIMGRDHFLALQPNPLYDAAGWIAQCQRFWTERLDRLETLLRDQT